MSKIGEEIKNYRQNNKLSMVKFAEMVGISQPYLSQIETGKVIPSDKIIKLLNAKTQINLELVKKDNKNDLPSPQENNIEQVSMISKIGATEYSIKVSTKLLGDIITISDREKRKLEGRHFFESAIINQTILNFLKENEQVLKETIRINLQNELDNLTREFLD